MGEHGTINLAEGTFTFGDALSWDGDQLVVKGVLESEQGSVGGSADRRRYPLLHVKRRKIQDGTEAGA